MILGQNALFKNREAKKKSEIGVVSSTRRSSLALFI